MCKIAKVSKSGYFKNLKKKEKCTQDELIIKEIFYCNKAKVGSRQIKLIALKHYGLTINRKKVQRIMKKENLICQIRKKQRINQCLREAEYIKENILNRDFKSQGVKTVACGDVTYIYYQNNKCYLNVYIDVKTGEVLEYALSSNQNKEFILNSTERLFMKERGIKMLHTDRGSQYTSKAFNDLMNKYKKLHSMSRPGTPLDNAVVESFFGHMKDYVEFNNCKTFEDVVAVVDKYMYDYNNRPQWNKNKLSPKQFALSLLAA